MRFAVTRPNPFDQAAAQVFLQTCERGGLCLLGMHHLELSPVLEMVAPIACKAQRLTSMHIGEASYDGDEVAFPGCFEPSYGIAGIFSVVGHPLHDALQMFCRRVECSFNGWIR